MAVASRQLTQCRSLSEFFRAEVDQAKRNQKLETSQEVEFYLVNLLQAFSKLDSTRVSLDEPLAFLLHRAVFSARPKRLEAFRQLGDVSLYVAGLFSPSLRRRSVNVDYAISMGSGAYASVAALIKKRTLRPRKVVVGLYLEMSEKFADLVEVLTQISERTTLGADSPDLAELYQRWCRTRAPHLAERMAALGVWPRF
jgi:hypothetical protein